MRNIKERHLTCIIGVGRRAMITLSSLLSYHLRICCQVYFRLLDAEVFIIPFVVQVSEPKQESSINQYILTGPRCNASDDFSAFKWLEIPNFGNLKEIDACDKSSIGNKAYQGQSQDDIFSTVPVIDASIYCNLRSKGISIRQIRYKDSMNPGAALFTLNIIFCLVLFLSLGATTITISENTFAQTGEESSPGFESSPPSEFVSGGNLSELPDSDSPLGLEPPDINGTYANPNVGLQVDLPKDWNGKEITFLLDMVVAAPPGIEIESIDEPGTAMIIQVLDREAFDELARMQGADPLSMKAGEGDQCKELPASFVTINGLKAEQRSGDCTDEEGSSTKVKAYTFATADGTIILLAFAGNSVNEYNQYLPQFEESVKTIKIENPGDINTSELYKKHKELEMQSQANVTMK